MSRSEAILINIINRNAAESNSVAYFVFINLCYSELFILPHHVHTTSELFMHLLALNKLWYGSCTLQKVEH